MQWFALILILPYFFLLLKIYNNLRKIRPFCTGESNRLLVSVIIACHNEEKNIIPLLHNISVQDYPPEFLEVIIIDDNSSDRTLEKASAFTGIEKLKVIKSIGKGKKTAIKTGVIASSGNLIITTDADCSMGKKWISTIAAFYCKYGPDMIICPVTLESNPGFLGRFQELEFLSLQGVTAGSATGGKASMCNGANLAFTRKAFQEHSDNLHYEIDSGDDVFFLHSLKKDVRSKIMWLESAEALVTAFPSITLLSFLKQRKRWISKGKAYTDKFTIGLAIVTFVTITILTILLIAGLFFREYLLTFLVAFTLKSVPDYLVLFNTASRYGNIRLMKWFLPSQLIYPFYVLAVSCYSLVTVRRSDT